ncbi:hypothetical protein PENSPDRAFT_755552 [Peniophora sp. CONT]|nr:hypothetical protein PENSPDRAFT_755552 [Peniophora sp. CONT]
MLAKVIVRGHARAGNSRHHRLLARTVSTTLQQRTGLSSHPVALVGPYGARNLSLWPFSSKAPDAAASAPAPIPAEPAALQTAPEPLAAASPMPLPPSIESPPPMLIDAASTIPDIPHQLGDCASAGLTSLGFLSWPAGLSVMLLEYINVSTGLSWFSTIVAGTVVSRLLVAPFAVIQQRNTARLAPFQPDLVALKTKMSEAQARGDQEGVRQGVLAQKAVYDKAGVGLGSMFLLPFVQLPVSLGMFFGVRRLMDSELASVHISGITDLVPFWADLSVADPYYILPLASTVLMNVALQVFSKDWGATADRKTVGLMLLAFRGISIVSLPVTAQFSLGLNVHIITGSLLMATQTLILRAAPVRRILGIPPLPPRDADWTTPSMKESIGYAKEWVADQQKAAEAKADAATKPKELEEFPDHNAGRKPPQKW